MKAFAKLKAHLTLLAIIFFSFYILTSCSKGKKNTGEDGSDSLNVVDIPPIHQIMPDSLRAYFADLIDRSNPPQTEIYNRFWRELPTNYRKSISLARDAFISYHSKAAEPPTYTDWHLMHTRITSIQNAVVDTLRQFYHNRTASQAGLAYLKPSEWANFGIIFEAENGKFIINLDPSFFNETIKLLSKEDIIYCHFLQEDRKLNFINRKNSSTNYDYMRSRLQRYERFIIENPALIQKRPENIKWIYFEIAKNYLSKNKQPFLKPEISPDTTIKVMNDQAYLTSLKQYVSEDWTSILQDLVSRCYDILANPEYADSIKDSLHNLFVEDLDYTLLRLRFPDDIPLPILGTMPADLYEGFQTRLDTLPEVDFNQYFTYIDGLPARYRESIPFARDAFIKTMTNAPGDIQVTAYDAMTGKMVIICKECTEPFKAHYRRSNTDGIILTGGFEWKKFGIKSEFADGQLWFNIDESYLDPAVEILTSQEGRYTRFAHNEMKIPYKTSSGTDFEVLKDKIHRYEEFLRNNQDIPVLQKRNLTRELSDMVDYFLQRITSSGAFKFTDHTVEKSVLIDQYRQFLAEDSLSVFRDVVKDYYLLYADTSQSSIDLSIRTSELRMTSREKLSKAYAVLGGE